MNNNVFSATKTAEMLLHDYKINKVSHAYMIIGEPGSGKSTLVKAFAELLLCEKPEGVRPCGECACCKYFDSFGEHPGVTVISNKDKATIGVGDIRDMSENVYSAPYIGSRKIYIINNADKMTQQAQNALLKILEEPPEYVVFFLLVSNRYSMLTTVISRCRVVNMTPYSQNALRNIISEADKALTVEQTETFIHRCGGSPGKLISYINDDDTYRGFVFDTVTALVDNDIEKLFDAAQKAENRDSALTLVTGINEIMRDVCVYMLNGEDSLVFNSDKFDNIKYISEKSTLKRVVCFLNEVERTVKMLQGNVSYQICVKNLLLKW